MIPSDAVSFHDLVPFSPFPTHFKRRKTSLGTYRPRVCFQKRRFCDETQRHPGTGNGLFIFSRAIRCRIARNSLRGMATSAISNVTYRAWQTIFAPILISFSRNVVNDQ